MRIWAFPSFYPYDSPGKKWHGIFAHRQYKGLIAAGAELCVVQPVLWHPPAPFHQLHKSWKKQAFLNYPQQREYDGITVYHPRISNKKPSRLERKPIDERYIDSIINFFKSKNIRLTPETDIFYSQWLPDATKVQQAAHRMGIKSAIMAIGDDVIIWPHEKPAYMNAFRKVWKEADIRMAVAAYLAKEANNILQEQLPYTVVRRGVEYDSFKPASPEEKAAVRRQFNIPQDKTIILTIGTAIKRKGWLDIFDALVEVRKSHPEVRLLGVHAGEKDIDLTTETKNRGIDDIFIDLGEVEPKQVAKLYNAAEIFCLPSHWEGIANAVVEAMASGLPVLTTDVSGHPELVTNGETGIMIPAKRPDLVQQELLKLLGNKELQATLGKNARDFIVNKWGNFADNAALLYRRLCQSN